MRKLIFSAAIALGLLPCTAPAVEIDGITATVGTTSILRSEVLAALQHRDVSEGATFESCRNELIERTLILKAAEAAKVTMQDWVVRDRIRSIIEEKFKGDRNVLVKTLSADRVSMADWERHVREDMIITAMRWNSVYKNVRVSPSEMRAEYKAHPERYQLEDKVTVSVILLSPEDRDKRTNVTEVIKSESFAAAARRYSSDTHAKEGGVWKDVTPGAVFKTEVCDEIARMPTGTISQWVDIDGWSFLLRKDKEIAGRARSFAEAYDDIEARVREENADRLMKAWIERLKADSYIRVY